MSRILFFESISQNSAHQTLEIGPLRSADFGMDAVVAAQQVEHEIRFSFARGDCLMIACLPPVYEIFVARVSGKQLSRAQTKTVCKSCSSLVLQLAC